MPTVWKSAPGFDLADALKRDTFGIAPRKERVAGASGGDIFGQKNAEKGG